MAPTVRETPARSCRAEALRWKFSSSMACSTLARVLSATDSGRLSTFDTVPTETPAAAATSLTLARCGVIDASSYCRSG